MKKLLVCLFLIGSIILTGCPKAQKTYRKAKEASAKIQIYGAKLIEANIAAFKAGEISKETFAELTELTGKFVKGVDLYREAIKEAEKILAAGNSLPTGTLDRLDALFSEKVSGVFISIVERFDLIPNFNSSAIKAIIAGIRTAVSVVQDAFASARAYEQRSLLWT